MKTVAMLAAAVSLCAALTGTLGCRLRGADSGISALAGDWTLTRGFGVTPPDHFETSLSADRNRVFVRSRWEAAHDGQVGLTLVGLATPELVLDTSGVESAAQVGPFVLRHTSRLNHGRLITDWSTSEYMGSSYRGSWIRTVSRDGAMLTLDIDAVSGAGDESRARLIFRRK